jgi:1,2-diacylglycerol 3-beta-galactosyltransferase
MPELMQVADIIVTKAGPGSICEALSCHLPIILSGYVPGQEEGNVDFVVKNSAGLLDLNPTTLIDALRRLLKPGSPELKRFRENAQRISHPTASFDIAQCLLNFLPTGETASVWQSAQWHQKRRTMTGRLRSAIRLSRFPARLPRKLAISPSLRHLLGADTRTRDLSQTLDATHVDRKS